MAQQIAPSEEVLRTALTQAELAFSTLPDNTRSDMNGLYTMLVNMTFEQLAAQAKREIAGADEPTRIHYAKQFDQLLYTIQTSHELASINNELESISAETSAIHTLMKEATPEEREALKDRFFASIERVKEMQPRILEINRKTEAGIKDLILVITGAKA